MAKLRIYGDTSGYTELNAPSVATNNSLVLPTSSATIDTLSRTGNILQVVQATTTTQSINSNVATGTNFDVLSASIIPTFSTSRILFMASIQVWMQQSGGSTIYGSSVILRNGSFLFGQVGAEVVNGAAVTELGHRVNVQYLDSPATTSSTTYTFRWQHNQPSPITTLTFNRNGALGALTLLEVA